MSKRSSKNDPRCSFCGRGQNQVEKIVTNLRENNFLNMKITETLNREWIIDRKIVRPKNEMVGHTGFVVSARFLSS